MNWALRSVDAFGHESWITWDGAHFVSTPDRSMAHRWGTKTDAKLHCLEHGYSDHWQPFDLAASPATLPSTPTVKQQGDVRCEDCDTPLPYVDAGPALCWSCRQEAWRVERFNRRHGGR